MIEPQKCDPSDVLDRERGSDLAKIAPPEGAVGRMDHVADSFSSHPLERGELIRKVTYGYKQMLNALYNNQLLLEPGKRSV